MAFNLDHTSNGNMTLQGANSAFTGVFQFPQPTSQNVVLMTYGDFDSTAISGLDEALLLKAKTGDIGSAAYLCTGTTSGTVVILNSDLYLYDVNLPRAVYNKNFVVDEFYEIAFLSDARTGDIATVASASQSSTYVLTGVYSNTSNWKQLENNIRCVNSVNSGITDEWNADMNLVCTGNVCIYASDLLKAPGSCCAYWGVNHVIEDLYTGDNQLISTGFLANEYVCKNNLNTLLSSEYLRTCDLTKCMVNYSLTTDFNACISGFTKTVDLYTGNNLLSGYVENSITGSAANQWYTGDSPIFWEPWDTEHTYVQHKNNLLTVAEDGYVSSGNLPAISLHDTFIISNPMDATSLDKAAIGDIAIDTVGNLNYILTGDYNVLEHWVQLSQYDGGVLSLNSQLPDNQGNIAINSTHISGAFGAVNTTCWTGIHLYNGSVDYANVFWYEPTNQDCTDFLALGIDARIKFGNGNCYSITECTIAYDGPYPPYARVISMTVCGTWPLVSNIPYPNVDLFDKDYGTKSSGSLSYGIEGLYNETNYVDSTYKISGNFTGDLGSYTLTDCFNNSLSLKCNCTHTHTGVYIITDFQSCVNDINGFQPSNLVNLEKSYTVSVSDTSSTAVSGSVLLGQNSRAKIPYSINHSASHFIEDGDAQITEVVSSLESTDDSNYHDILRIPMCLNTFGFVSSRIIGVSADKTKYASFTVEAPVSRETSDAFIAHEVNVTTHARNFGYNFCATITGSSDSINVAVKGYSTQNFCWTAYTKHLNVMGQTLDDAIVAKYFDGVTNNWYSLSRWFTDSSLETQAQLMPMSSSDVYMYGATGACINLDDPNWVRPHSLDTTNVTDPKGVCFVSTLGASFDGEVYGNASFFGSIFR